MTTEIKTDDDPHGLIDLITSDILTASFARISTRIRLLAR